MDIDIHFLGAVLRQEGAYFAAKRNGVTKAMLRGDAARGWELLDQHVMEFGEVPSEDYFVALSKISLEPPGDNAEVWLEQIRKRALYNKLLSIQEILTDFLTKHQTDDALTAVEEGLFSIHKDRLSGSKLGSLLSVGDDVLDHYERMKNGERGILTPWPAMNDQTLGWWNGDMVTIVARMAVGKTFFLLMLARQAWLEGKKVLFVGTEMGRSKLALRFYAIHLSLPYDEFKRGQLGVHQEQKMREEIKALVNEEGFYIVGDEFDAKMTEIEAAVDQIRPDILFVDGLYLIKNEGRNRHEKVSNTADDLKRLAKSRGIPTVASTQFNRDVAGNSKSAVSAGSIGITDVIGWNSDVIYALYQTEDMKEDDLMGVRPLKIREGSGEDFFLKWDFKTMQFTQEDIDQDGEFYGGDYDRVEEDLDTSDGDSLF